MNTLSQTAEFQTSQRPVRLGQPSISKVVMWTLLFQLAWHFRTILPFLKEGNFGDSDDFMRLHQVRNWMDGQSWFDVSVPRMNPTTGGDLHWSRLVDVPLAGLTWFFDLFTDTVLAERLAAIVWPTALLVLTVIALLAVCERLYPATNRMLALLFTVTCVTAMVEFAPARIDHHNIQILFFSVILLGLVNADRKWAHYLIGSIMVASVVIGLDLALMLALILVWLGVEWVFGMDHDGSGLKRTALGMTGACLLLYPVSIPSTQWFIAQCDAFSLFYLTTFLFVSAGFGALWIATRYLPDQNYWKMVASRAVAGGIAGGAVLATLYNFYPQCMAGPLAGISPELKTVWLDSVIEAKGLIESAKELDAGLYAMPAFMLMNLVLGLLFLRKGILGPRFIAIWAAIAITMILGFFQIRTLRIGMFATVPVGVIAAQLAWQFFEKRYSDNRVFAYAATALVGLFLISPTWLIGGNALASRLQPVVDTTASSISVESQPAWALDPARTGCNLESDFRVLNALPDGHVFNSVNIGPAILVFTDHTMIGANYHRNEEAILSTYRFFNSPSADARKLASEKQADYVVMCKLHPLGITEVEKDDRLGSRLLHGDAPDWLEVISTRDDRLLVARISR